jgi:hypothetical protein
MSKLLTFRPGGSRRSVRAWTEVESCGRFPQAEARNRANARDGLAFGISELVMRMSAGAHTSAAHFSAALMTASRVLPMSDGISP